MEFGVFDHLDRNDLPLRNFYDARLELITAYEKAGFYAYHVAEHHSTPIGMGNFVGGWLLRPNAYWRLFSSTRN